MDEKEVKALFEQFKEYLTLDQVRNTLQANKADKAKTLTDLQYKRDQIVKKNKGNIKLEMQKKNSEKEEEKKQAIKVAEEER